MGRSGRGNRDGIRGSRYTGREVAAIDSLRARASCCGDGRQMAVIVGGVDVERKRDG